VRRHASVPSCKNRSAILGLLLSNPVHKPFARGPFNDAA
jgi:hypothetical protein